MNLDGSLSAIADAFGKKGLALIPEIWPSTSPRAWQLLGAYALVLGALLAPLIGGLEYVVVLGCGALMHGSRAFGMEPQPELYTAGVLAIVGCLCMDQAKKKPEDESQKKGRKTKKR